MVKESKEYVVTARDCGGNGVLRPEALMNMWVETIIDRSEELGVGPSYMRREGLGWVLVKNTLDIKRWPAAGECVTVNSWPVGRKWFFAYRRFVLEDAAGEAIITGESCWTLLDLIARKSVEITKRLEETYGFNDMDHQVLKFGNLKAVEDAQYEARCRVGPEVIDANGHVSNTVYLSWALGMLPEVTAKGGMRRIECAFKREALLGMDIEAKAAADGNGRVTRHEIKDSKGETLFLMRAEWA
jgi:medium-chain acyl-[acyl-carrier-protein] hydrolase